MQLFTVARTQKGRIENNGNEKGCKEGYELTAFDQARWQRASLGATILRAETAAIAAVALTSALLSS